MGDISRIPSSVTNITTVMMESQRNMGPDGLVFDPFSRKREPCDHYFNVDLETVLTFSLQRAPVTCVLVLTDSTPTLTQVCAISSTPVLTELPRNTPAHLDSGLMNTAESATGPRPQTGRTVKLILMLWKLLMDSSALRLLPLMSLASMTLTPSMLTLTTAQSSSSV